MLTEWIVQGNKSNI